MLKTIYKTTGVITQKNMISPTDKRETFIYFILVEN